MFLNTVGNPDFAMEGNRTTDGGFLVITSSTPGSLFTFDGLDFAAYRSSGTDPADLTISVLGLKGGLTPPPPRHLHTASIQSEKLDHRVCLEPSWPQPRRTRNQTAGRTFSRQFRRRRRQYPTHSCCGFGSGIRHSRSARCRPCRFPCRKTAQKLIFRVTSSIRKPIGYGADGTHIKPRSENVGVRSAPSTYVLHLGYAG
jgi:hypothetical protein